MEQDERVSIPDYLHESCELFWMKFSNLVNETLAQCPATLRDELKMRIGEKTSVYGTSDTIYKDIS
jgi:hypothetical protein